MEIIKLEDFISETIQGFVNGVEDAREKIKERGATIVVDLVSGDIPKNQLRDRGGFLVQNIEFDIALTVEKGSTKEGIVGVMAGIFGAGAKGTNTMENQSLHRIKFAIPIQFYSSSKAKDE